MNTNRNTWILLAILTALTVFVGLLWKPRLTTDSYYYLDMVKVFKGELPISYAVPPFCYRLLFPLIVSLIPFDSILVWVSINIISIVGITIVTFFIIKSFEVHDFGAFVATGLFTVSIPTLSFVPHIIVDLPAIFFMEIALFGIIHEWNDENIFLMLAIGVLFKETVLIVALIWIIYANRKIKRATAFLSLLGCSMIYLTIRSYFDMRFGVSGTWIWGWNNWYNFIVIPMQTLRSFIFTYMFVIPAFIISIIILIKTREIQSDDAKLAIRWLKITIFPFLALVFAGFFMAYLDMRFLWPLCISFLPIIGVGSDIFKNVIINKFWKCEGRKMHGGVLKG